MEMSTLPILRKTTAGPDGPRLYWLTPNRIGLGRPLKGAQPWAMATLRCGMGLLLGWLLALPSLMAQPATPTGLHALAQDQANELNWVASAGATAYNLYVSEDSATFAPLATVNAPNTNYTHSGLALSLIHI